MEEYKPNQIYIGLPVLVYVKPDMLALVQAKLYELKALLREAQTEGL